MTPESISSFNLDLSLELQPIVLTDILEIASGMSYPNLQNKYILRKHLPAFQTNSLFQDFWLVVLKLVHIQTQLSSFLHPTSVTAHCISCCHPSSLLLPSPLHFPVWSFHYLSAPFSQPFVAACIFQKIPTISLIPHNLTGLSNSLTTNRRRQKWHQG